MKPGYKKTEAGIIPNDWEIYSLGKLGECLIGLTYKPSDVQEHGTLVLRSSNIQDEALAFEDNVFVDTVIPDRIMVRPGDVLVCVRNGSRNLIGKSVLLDERTLGMTFGAFMAIYRSPIGKFASYLFQSDIIKRQINEHLGATINQITNKSLNSFRVPLPKFDTERDAITEVLSDVDALIAALDRLIEKNRDIKQATMQQLLTGKIRLPGFSGKWETKQVASFTNCVAGGTPSTLVRSYWDGSIKWMSSGDLHLKRVKDVPGRITQAGLDNSAATILPKQCVLIGLAGQGKTRGTVAINLAELSTNQSIGAILPNDTFVPDYLFHNLDSRYTELRELSSGGGRGGLNLKLLGSLEIPLPSIPEQAAIASVLSDMDAEISALEARRNKTRALKQGMMQELLTGKTRLI
jgi:type I restriction enzyme S subunit